MIKFSLLALLVLLVLCLTPMDAARKRKQGRSGRQTTVISCRVFRKGVCKKTKSNIILVNKSISSSHKCQQFCYATPGCAAFTHFEQSRKEDKKCVLFRDCNGKLSKCDDCISGPIMPRITECIAARQEVAPAPTTETPGKPCSSGCTGLCLGPRCPELISGLNTTSASSPSSANIDDSRDSFETVNDNEDSFDTSVQDAPREQGELDVTSETETETETEEYEYEYDDSEYAVEDTDYNDDVDVNFDYNDGSDDVVSDDYEQTEYIDDSQDYLNVDTPVDFPLDSNAIDEPEEEEEEVDINIDEGFLSDSSGDPVSVPAVETVPKFGSTSSQPNTGGNTFVFFFCVLGGHNSGGAVSLVDMINTGLGNAAQSLSIAPLPSTVMRGGEVSSRYSNGGSITTCGNGFTILSPYGYIYKPGECFDLNIRNNNWEETGAALTSYRRGATITKLGRYLLATGGVRKNKPLNTIEAFDPARPAKGWKKLEKLSMPAAVSEHCTVTVDGRKGKEVIITGGRGRENRALKLDVKNQRWYSLNRMSTGRRKHACVKAKINGRPGLVVSGGSSRKDKNMTSVEFYDALTGEWLSLPPLRRGRRSHVMTVTAGKLLVAGGEGRGRAGKDYLDDMEIFNGRRWVTSSQKLDRPRSSFSLVKIPKRKSRSVKQTKKMSRRKNKRNRSPRRS